MADYHFQPDACIDQRSGNDNGEPRDGLPCFTHISTALQRGYSNLLIRCGCYHEKILVDRDHVTFWGEGADITTIVHGDAHGTLDDQGVPLGSGGSATVTISGYGFTAYGISFENSFDYPGEQRRQAINGIHQSGLQAVALRTTAGSDRALFDQCRFQGYQDTLFLDAGRHYLRTCTIGGTIDFIFGAGTAVFEHCCIVSREVGQPPIEGCITAPSTKSSVKDGFVFLHCTLEKETPSVPDSSVFLGRPWHPGGDTQAWPAAVFSHCKMGAHIKTEGWTSMHSRTKDGIEAVWQPWQARFFEYDSRGPGQGPSSLSRVLLTPAQAATHTCDLALEPWIAAEDPRLQRPSA